MGKTKGEGIIPRPGQCIGPLIELHTESASVECVGFGNPVLERDRDNYYLSLL
jgi:hypothetical protein